MANNVNETDSDHLCCPICFELFADPKILHCGHSLCTTCIPMTTAGTIQCPICREETATPVNGLITNYALREAVEETKKKLGKIGMHPCQSCKETYATEGMWSCKECNLALICPSCGMKNHRNHTAEPMAEFLEQARSQFADWRQVTQVMLDEIDSNKRQIQADYDDAEGHIRNLREDQLPKFIAEFEKATKEIDDCNNSVHENLPPTPGVDALAVSGKLTEFMGETTKKLKILMAKQRFLKADASLVLDVLRDTSDTVKAALRRMSMLDKMADWKLDLEENGGKEHVDEQGDTWKSPMGYFTEDANGNRIVDLRFDKETGMVIMEHERAAAMRGHQKGIAGKQHETARRKRGRGGHADSAAVASALEDSEGERSRQSQPRSSLSGVRQFFVALAAGGETLPPPQLVKKMVAKSIELSKTLKDHRIVVFCDAQDTVKFLAKRAVKRGVSAMVLNASMDEVTRDDIVARFSTDENRVLIVPMELANVVDVQSVRIFINIKLPHRLRNYIECIGRNGHSTQTRVVINLVQSPEDVKPFERFYNTSIDEMPENIQDLL